MCVFRTVDVLSTEQTDCGQIFTLETATGCCRFIAPTRGRGHSTGGRDTGQISVDVVCDVRQLSVDVVRDVRQLSVHVVRDVRQLTWCVTSDS